MQSSYLICSSGQFPKLFLHYGKTAKWYNMDPTNFHILPQFSVKVYLVVMLIKDPHISLSKLKLCRFFSWTEPKPPTVCASSYLLHICLFSYLFTMATILKAVYFFSTWNWVNKVFDFKWVPTHTKWKGGGSVRETWLRKIDMMLLILGGLWAFGGRRQQMWGVCLREIDLFCCESASS